MVISKRPGLEDFPLIVIDPGTGSVVASFALVFNAGEAVKVNLP
jgi:hypothetical protein